MEPGQGLALLVIAFAGALLPVLSRRVAIPAMVAEILFGVLLAQVGFARAFQGEWLPFLAHFGFLMLMFLAGLEVDFVTLRREPLSHLGIYLGLFGLTLILAYGAARLLGQGLFLALVLSTTSLGLVLQGLRDMDLSKTPLGQSVLLCATVADFCTLLGLTALVLYHDHGFSWRLIQPLLAFLVFGVVLWAVRLWVWWYPRQACSLLGSSDPSEMGVRAALALLFVFVGLSELMGLEPILGAFIGGCVLSMAFAKRGLMEEKLAGFGYGFLIPIFFIHVGLQFSMEAFTRTETMLFTLNLLLVAVTVKILPSLLLALRGISMRACLLAGVLLSARLSLIVAAASIGVEKGLLPAEMEPGILMLALVTASLAPVLFRKLGHAWLTPGTKVG